MQSCVGDSGEKSGAEDRSGVGGLGRRSRSLPAELRQRSLAGAAAPYPAYVQDVSFQNPARALLISVQPLPEFKLEV